MRDSTHFIIKCEDSRVWTAKHLLCDLAKSVVSLEKRQASKQNIAIPLTWYTVLVFILLMAFLPSEFLVGWFLLSRVFKFPILLSQGLKSYLTCILGFEIPSFSGSWV